MGKRRIETRRILEPRDQTVFRISLRSFLQQVIYKSLLFNLKSEHLLFYKCLKLSDFKLFNSLTC